MSVSEIARRPRTACGACTKNLRRLRCDALLRCCVSGRLTPNSKHEEKENAEKEVILVYLKSRMTPFFLRSSSRRDRLVRQPTDSTLRERLRQQRIGTEHVLEADALYCNWVD